LPHAAAGAGGFIHRLMWISRRDAEVAEMRRMELVITYSLQDADEMSSSFSKIILCSRLDFSVLRG
jgi:hypothetical protein